MNSKFYHVPTRRLSTETHSSESDEYNGVGPQSVGLLDEGAVGTVDGNRAGVLLVAMEIHFRPY